MEDDEDDDEDEEEDDEDDEDGVDDEDNDECIAHSFCVHFCAYAFECVYVAASPTCHAKSHLFSSSLPRLPPTSAFFLPSSQDNCTVMTLLSAHLSHS